MNLRFGEEALFAVALFANFGSGSCTLGRSTHRRRRPMCDRRGRATKFCTLLEWEKTWKATDLGQDVNQDVFKENPFMM